MVDTEPILDIVVLLGSKIWTFQELNMTQYDFLKTLNKVYRSYTWDYTDNRLVGTRGRRTFNPVTAVAYSVGYGYNPPTKRGTLTAARSLGITTALANAVYSQSNRGHAQIIRGKMCDTVL